MDIPLHFAIFLNFILFDVISAKSGRINCSFSRLDPCMNEYALVDESNGLAWRLGDGYLGYENNHFLDASPFGEYVYIAGSTSESEHHEWTDLVSPEFRVDSAGGCLGFVYHDNWCDYYAPQRRSLRVLLRPVNDENDGNTTDILLREYLCAATSTWLNEDIAIVLPPASPSSTSKADATARYRLVFSGMQHEFDNHVIAVDHVYYTPRSCALPTSSTSYAPGDCDFEGTDLCGYAPDYTWAHADLTWMTGRREMLAHGAGVAADEAPAGHFLMLVWADAGTFYPGSYNYVGLVSPVIALGGEGCLSVTYHNGVDADPTKQPPSLVLRRVQDPTGYAPSVGEILHEFPPTLGHRWHRSFIPLPAGTYALAFEACVTYPYGRGENDVIGLDDVEVHAQSCDAVRPMANACERMGGAEDSSNLCHGRGRCLGNAIKTAGCSCDFGFFGSRCQFGKTENYDSFDNSAATTLPCLIRFTCLSYISSMIHISYILRLFEL